MLDKGLRALFICDEGQKRIALAAIQYGPGCPAALLETVAGAGVRHGGRSGRIGLGGFGYGIGLDDRLRHRHEGLDLIVQLGQVRRPGPAWGLVLRVRHAVLCPVQTELCISAPWFEWPNQ
jgi:hypothetical protein